MAESVLTGARVAGIAAAVPSDRRSFADLAALIGTDAAHKQISSSGVAERRVARPGQTSADFCQAAAERLLQVAGMTADRVGGLIFVTQTPDHYMPATACILHGKMGLAKSCATFEISLGCSGWVYALWLAHMMVGAGAGPVLVLSGDVSCPDCQSPEDRYGSIAGDAGTATLVVPDANGRAAFRLGTDGTGWQSIWIPAGGFRLRPGPATQVLKPCPDGVSRSDEHFHLDGPDVFAFTIREVPPLVEGTLALAGWPKESVDIFAFHQANKFMLDYLVKKMRVPAERTPFSLQSFGNTSSASIPLTLATQRREALSAAPQKVLAAGFGVGYSWGAVALTLGDLILPELVELP